MEISSEISKRKGVSRLFTFLHHYILQTIVIIIRTDFVRDPNILPYCVLDFVPRVNLPVDYTRHMSYDPRPICPDQSRVVSVGLPVFRTRLKYVEPLTSVSHLVRFSFMYSTIELLDCIFKSHIPFLFHFFLFFIFKPNQQHRIHVTTNKVPTMEYIKM